MSGAQLLHRHTGGGERLDFAVELLEDGEVSPYRILNGGLGAAVASSPPPHAMVEFVAHPGFPRTVVELVFVSVPDAVWVFSPLLVGNLREVRELSSPDTALNRQLDETEQDLVGEFGEILGEETVSRVVRESFDLISGKATVNEFVGMLARRASRRRLVVLATQVVAPADADPSPTEADSSSGRGAQRPGTSET